jgi:hypothetical protein
VDTAVSTLVPAGGLSAILLALCGYLFKTIPADRADFREDLAEERARTAAAEERTRAALERADAAQAQIDEERRLRRAAEAAAAAAEARLHTQDLSLRWYVAERARLLALPEAETHDDASQ